MYTMYSYMVYYYVTRTGIPVLMGYSILYSMLYHWGDAYHARCEHVLWMDMPRASNGRRSHAP